MITLPNGKCPQCGGEIRTSTIEAHPSRDDEAVQAFWCNKCERIVKSITISLRPKEKPGTGT